MAEYTSDVVSGNQSFKPFPSGQMGVRYSKFEATTTLATSDVIKMVDVFSGETVHDVVLKVDDLDTGTTLVLDVGDGGDVGRVLDRHVGHCSTLSNMLSIIAR